MPSFAAPNATMYYDIISQDITSPSSHKTILLVHGFASTPENDFAAQLPQLRLHYTLLAPHLHGYGRSSHRDAYARSYYRDDAADLVALLDNLHLQHVFVLGFSDGAIVSLLLAALYPERVTALAIHGAQAIVTAQDAAGIRHWLLEKPLSADVQAELASLHGEPYWRSLPRMYVAIQEQLVEAGGVLITDEELAAIRCPTLVMHGTYDRIVPVQYAQMLHERIAGSHLLLFDAGHAAHIRCEQAYTATVLRFFQNPQQFIV